MSADAEDGSELPDELFRSTRGRGNVGHLDPDCRNLKQGFNFRAVPTEYLRRADGRLCSICGDGRRLE